MDARAFVENAVTTTRQEGVRRGLQSAGRDLLFGAYNNLPVTYGTPIFDREWDVLVVLDACRPDAITEVQDEYEFLPAEIPTTYSVASQSEMWMRRNFAPEYDAEVATTAYVTGNPYSDRVCEEGRFALLDEVWRYAWDEEVGSISADAITDRGIAIGRKHSFERLILHYMQPHFPSFPDPLGSSMDLETFGRGWNSIWDRLESGEISVERVWQSYVRNLEYVLDSVGVLLRNLNASRVVLSADHGNAFGEWGLYGHPVNKPAPVLRRVPWIPVDADDRSEYSPTVEVPEQMDISGVEQRLEDLGYVS